MIINKYVNNSPLLNGGFCDVEMQVGVCVGGGGWFRASVISLGSCVILAWFCNS